MDSLVTFSIITVTFNAEKYLRDTLESLLCQAFNDYEYIVVDGGSSDHTIEILEQYSQKFNGRLRYISEPDNGLYDAMNKGIRMAKGTYIGIINADDRYRPETLQQVYNTIKTAETCPDVVYSDLDVINDQGQVIRTIIGDHGRLKRGMLVNHPTCFVHREAYKKYGTFDLKYRICGDYDLMLRIFHQGGTFRKCNYTLAEYRWGGLSTANYNSILEKYDIQRKYYGFIHCLSIRSVGFVRCKIICRLRKGVTPTIRFLYRFYPYTTSNIFNRGLFFIKGVKCGKNLKTRGTIKIVKTRGYSTDISIGNNAAIFSSLLANPVSNANKTVLYAFKNGQIRIGNNVGISNSNIVSFESVTIEDDVLIGANTCIWDTDFHSIYLDKRLDNNSGIVSKPVIIKRGAFIGAGVYVMKGVTIGEEAVIGAGSVVTKDIPPKEIWAGNPCRFIRKIV